MAASSATRRARSCGDRPAQQVAKHLLRGLEGLAQQPMRRSAGRPAEAVLEQQDQMIVAWVELRLYSACRRWGRRRPSSSKPPERDRVAGGQAGDHAALAVPQHPGEDRERRRQAVPEPAVVRGRRRFEQQPSGLDRSLEPDLPIVPCVGLVEQRRRSRADRPPQSRARRRPPGIGGPEPRRRKRPRPAGSGWAVPGDRRGAERRRSDRIARRCCRSGRPAAETVGQRLGTGGGAPGVQDRAVTISTCRRNRGQLESRTGERSRTEPRQAETLRAARPPGWPDWPA